ncbi:hypothetical protein MRX96_058216 [Rhipicephalus microplus]
MRPKSGSSSSHYAPPLAHSRRHPSLNNRAQNAVTGSLMGLEPEVLGSARSSTSPAIAELRGRRRWPKRSRVQGRHDSTTTRRKAPYAARPVKQDRKKKRRPRENEKTVASAVVHWPACANGFDVGVCALALIP